jgi:parallel beta-helix repeat protein
MGSGDDCQLVGNSAISNQLDGIEVFGVRNVIRGNLARGNGNGTTSFDLMEGNLPSTCANTWSLNVKQTDNDPANTCIR